MAAPNKFHLFGGLPFLFVILQLLILSENQYGPWRGDRHRTEVPAMIDDDDER
jgi:hypothetical protein